MSESKRIPSREELEDFVILLKRYSAACRFALRADMNGWRGLREDPYIPASKLRRKIGEHVSACNFLAPFGWSDRVREAIGALCRGRYHYRELRYQDLVPVTEGEDVGKHKVVFNPARAESMLNDLDRSIGELEDAVRTSPIDPAAGTAEPSVPPSSDARDADADVWISFDQAVLYTKMTKPEICRACDEGVRSIGHHKGRKVHVADIMKYANDRQKGQD